MVPCPFVWHPFWNTPAWKSKTTKKEFAWEFKRCGFNPWVGKIPWSKKWQPTPLFLPGKSHGQRSLGGCSPGAAKSQKQLNRAQANSVSSGRRRGRPVTAKSRALETGRPGSESHLHPQVWPTSSLDLSVLACKNGVIIKAPFTGRAPHVAPGVKRLRSMRSQSRRLWATSLSFTFHRVGLLCGKWGREGVWRAGWAPGTWTEWTAACVSC